MKILIIYLPLSEPFFPSVVQKIAAKTGWNFKVIYAQQGTCNQSYPADIFIPVKLLATKNRLLKTILQPFRYYKIIKEFQPDVIHCFNEIFSPTLTETILLSKLANCQGVIVNYSWENLDWYRFPYKIFCSYNRQHLDYSLTTNDKATKHNVGLGLSADRVKKIWWAIDTATFTPAPHSIQSPQNYGLVYIGRLVPEKGILTILQALSRLPEGVSLSIIGTGPVENHIRKSVSDMGLSHRVLLYGHKNYTEIREILHQNDILVLPSLTTAYWAEQFGRVILEAMACGVPVIGSSSGAIPEIIGDSGLIFQEGNAADLVDKIAYLANNQDAYNNLHLQGMERVQQNFTQDIFVDHLIAFYSTSKNDVT